MHRRIKGPPSWGTREEIEEVMVQLTIYGDFPRAVEVIKVA